MSNLFTPPQQELVEPLKRARLAHWQRFVDLGLPDSRNENYHYVRLQNRLLGKFQRAEGQQEAGKLSVLDECRHSHIVFVNGFLRLDLSDVTALPKGTFALELPAAFRSYSALLSARLAKLLKEENDPFALLNVALMQDGGFLYIAPRQKIEAPIQILSVTNCPQEHFWIMPRLQVFVSKLSELTLLYTCQHIDGQDCLYNSAIDLEIDEGARVKLATVDVESVPEAAYRFENFRARLMKNSLLETLQVSNGDRTRRDYNIQLAGSGAEATLRGLWFLNANKESHTNVTIEHQEPYTRSMQHFKGVLDDKAQASFQGKILVRKKAQKTESYQLNKNLMLSDEAQGYTRPNLEIFADDVKASHGATVGQLDEEQLFYLKSRGLNLALARKILVRGFCDELLLRLPLDSQRMTCIESVERFCD